MVDVEYEYETVRLSLVIDVYLDEYFIINIVNVTSDVLNSRVFIVASIAKCSHNLFIGVICICV